MKAIGYFKGSASHWTQTDIPDLHADKRIATLIDTSKSLFVNVFWYTLYILHILTGEWGKLKYSFIYFLFWVVSSQIWCERVLYSLWLMLGLKKVIYTAWIRRIKIKDISFLISATDISEMQPDELFWPKTNFRLVCLTNRNWCNFC
jgi:hypothetical protein